MPSAQNHLIEGLPAAERKRLLQQCVPVPLVMSAVLCERGDVTRHVYFPTAGFLSLVTRVDHHPGLEVGMIGCEGMLGLELVLGVGTAPLRALVQGPGQALRLSATALALEISRSVALRHQLDRYLYVRMAQLAVSAACLRFHMIGPRLARWLLMSHDRAQADEFRVTHEFLAYMLGVRRVGITMAAGALQRRGLITYHRGDLKVLDRSGLEAAACSCYAADQQGYLKLLGPLGGAVPRAAGHGALAAVPCEADLAR